MKPFKNPGPILILLVALFAVLFLWREEEVARGAQTIPTVPEKLRTPDWPGAEVDSVAAWKSPSGEILLFVSGKTSNEIYVCDGSNGRLLDRIGARPEDTQGLSRPNGLAVAEDLLFVVERDNRRVQVYSLPALESLGTFGGDELWYPYGIDLYREGEAYEVFVTDNYGLDLESGARAPLDLRVKHFRVSIAEGKVAVTLENSFGATDGPGVLHKVESILVDGDADRIYVCDETDLSVKIYRTDGTFTGTIFGKGTIDFEPEGMIVVKETPLHTDGVLVVTDQGEDRTLFRVYSLSEGEFLGNFTGDPELANTDGICFLSGDFGPFEKGALYAVHADSRVQAYSWADIEDALGGD